MNNIIFKTEFLRGAKGDAGTAQNYEVPTGAVIAYDGDDIPNGYELTTPPEGMPIGSNVSELTINNIVRGTITNTAEGEITT